MSLSNFNPANESQLHVSFCLLHDNPSLKAAVRVVTHCSQAQFKLYQKSIKLELKLKHQHQHQHHISPASEQSLDPQKILPKYTEISIPLDLANAHLINPEYDGPPIAILYDTHPFLVLSKPAGVHGHPLKYSDTTNCLSFLRSIGRGDLLNINSHLKERGLLHRLDGVTSGVLIYVRDENLWQEIFHKKEEYVVAKTYLAIVEGIVEEKGDGKYFELTHRLVASEKKGHKMRAEIVKKDGSENQGEARDEKNPSEMIAHLKVECLAHNQEENLSLLKVHLAEGHRHQIRVQLAAIGHSILGDELYGGKKAERVFLHSYSYRCNTKDKSEIEFCDSSTHSFMRYFSN
jgi:23S rRNA pseudouridine1911/1915/1917 synthase